MTTMSPMGYQSIRCRTNPFRSTLLVRHCYPSIHEHRVTAQPNGHTQPRTSMMINICSKLSLRPMALRMTSVVHTSMTLVKLCALSIMERKSSSQVAKFLACCRHDECRWRLSKCIFGLHRVQPKNDPQHAHRTVLHIGTVLYVTPQKYLVKPRVGGTPPPHTHVKQDSRMHLRQLGLNILGKHKDGV